MNESCSVLANEAPARAAQASLMQDRIQRVLDVTARQWRLQADNGEPRRISRHERAVRSANTQIRIPD